MTISGTYNGTQSATLTVNAPTVSSVAGESGDSDGRSVFDRYGDVEQRGAGGWGSGDAGESNTAAATVPASVTVAAGATSATFTATTVAVGTTTAVTISGTYNGTQGTTLTVNPPAVVVSSVSLNPTSVTGGALRPVR